MEHRDAESPPAAPPVPATLSGSSEKGLLSFLDSIAASAEAIVTGDQHLLKLKRFRGIVIVSLREFLATR